MKVETDRIEFKETLSKGFTSEVDFIGTTFIYTCLKPPYKVK